MLNSPVDESIEKNPILVEAFINIPDYEVKKVSLFFRKKGELKYIEAPMFKIDLEYLGEIPGNFVGIAGIEYFIVVDTYDMGMIGLPNVNPTDNPFRVDVEKKKIIYTKKRVKELDPKYTILNPEPGIEVIDDEMMLSLSYFQMDNIDPSETKIFVNNIDVSDRVDFRDSYFVYYPQNIVYGPQNVKVILIDDFGVEYNPIEWSFAIIKQEDVSLFAFKQSGKIKTDYASSVVDTVNFKESTAEARISSLENERSELETKTGLLQEQIHGLQSKLDSTAEKLLTHRVSLTEATEQQKNLMETNDRLQRECEETSQRIMQLDSAIVESNLKIEKSQKQILSIDQSFEGMLEERSKIKLILDEEILLHEQKNEQQTTLIQKP